MKIFQKMTIKTSITTLLIICFTLCSFAQRVNEHGLKMVSEVEVFDWELDKILLKYNEQNRLVGMTVYKDWNWNKAKYDAKTYVPNYELYAEYYIKDGKMICKRYDEEYNNTLYDFKFDEWGHIVSFKEKYLAEWHNGYVAEHEYDYSYDERMKRYVMSDINFMNRSYQDIRKGINIDPVHKNDTNISIEWILYFANCEYSVDYYFKVSDWIDCINDYFHIAWWDKKAGCDNQYEYGYDSNGNLIAVRENDPATRIERVDGVEYRYPYTVETTIKLKYL
ncbi:MAG: hypothetical protein HDS70_08615 [Bacteroidales bacterium]|nr:hypothetical protein [Bacteroidales bacterium]